MNRILILTNSTIGLYKFRKELLEKLGKTHKVFVSVPSDGFENELKNLDIHYIKTPVDRRGTNPLRDFLLLCRYFFIIIRTRPNVILTYTVKPNIYGNLAAKLFLIPVISTITGLGDGFLNDRLSGKLVRFLYRIALWRTKTVAFQNREDVTVLSNYGIIRNQNLLFVKGSGVNLSQHTPIKYPNDGTINFLFIGRKMTTKGVGHLINASEKLKKEGYIFKTMLIGDTDEADITERLEKSEKDGIITNLSFQKNVSDFIAKAHVVVLPSYSEGMSNVLLEAAASARPLITTDVSGCREVVDEGINGFLCTPKSDESLYRAMKDFLNIDNSHRESMGLKSREKVEKEFNRNDVINIMINEIVRLEKK